MMSFLSFKRITGSIKADFKSKEALASLIFLLALIAFESFFFQIRFRHYFESIRRHEYLVGFGGLLIVCASWFWVGLFFLASLLSKYSARVLYFLLFALAVGFEYGYQKAFGQFTAVSQLRTALFEATWQQRLDAMVAYANWLAIVPCLAYGILLFAFRRRRERSLVTFGIVLLALIGFYSAIGPYISGHFTTVSLTAFMRTVVTSPWKWAAGYEGPRDTVAQHAGSRPQNNIILVIDESVRGDHLSINGYSRATTPYLKELSGRGWLYNWGIAVSGTTCSFDSDNLLLTGLTSAQLPDTDFKVRRVPTIFQYAKAMGYQTHFLDVQKDVDWLGTAADAKFIDDWQRANAFSAPNFYERDLRLAQRINDITGNSTGHFIWVIKSGIHFPYSRALPRSAVEWQPADFSDRIPHAGRK